VSSLHLINPEGNTMDSDNFHSGYD